MLSQLKSMSHRLNLIVYSYMFLSPWDHHQTVYIINRIKLTEISIWIHISAQRVPTMKVVENCPFCYDENYNIEKNIIKYWTIKNLYLEVIKGSCTRILRI
jgi:hypothetical protein